MSDTPEKIDTNAALEKIASSLEKLQSHMSRADRDDVQCDFGEYTAFLWQPENSRLRPVPKVQRIPLNLLHGIEQVRETLLENTIRFAKGLPANNALLWGARGTGKSSIVKAIHNHVTNLPVEMDSKLILVEIQRDDIASVDRLLEALRDQKERVLLYCDDLSFDQDDATYKSLKAILDGGVLGRPENILFYATSNRRHLMPRDMIENEQATGVHPGEAIEEKLSLSDRFGLWLGFHRCDQNTYLKMVHAYCDYFGLDKAEDLEFRAKQWSTTRGSRSGRVAWQFIQDLAGEQGKSLKFE